MAMKKKNSGYIVSKDGRDVKILDNPEINAGLVCEIPDGIKVKIVSKPNKQFYGIGVSESVVGFVQKEFLKVE